GKTLCTLVHSLNRWRVSTGEEIPQPELQGSPPSTSITLSSDGTLSAWSDFKGSALVLDTATGRALLTIRPSEGIAHPLALSRQSLPSPLRRRLQFARQDRAANH